MSIRLSEKHGVNPMIPLCFICNQGKNEILLLGRITGKQKEAMGLRQDDVDPEAPRNMVLDKGPCDTCLEIMKQGVIVISVKAGSDHENPQRTGGWIAVKDEAVERWREVFGDSVDPMLKMRMAFIEDEVWKVLHLPMPGDEEYDEVPHSLSELKEKQDGEVDKGAA